MKPNPYNYNMPVDQEMFYGRDRQLGNILAQLLSAKGDSVALIGGRRMGKTSFLEALVRALNEVDTLPYKNYLPLPIYLDFSGEGVNSSREFFKRVIEETQFGWANLGDDETLAIPDDLGKDTPLGPTLKRSMLKWANSIVKQFGRQPRLILLLDECEQIATHDWTRELYGDLRYLLDGQATRNFLKVVMAGSHRFLTEVYQAGSPLQNILQYHRLFAFDKATTEGLIQEPTGHVVSDDLAVTVWDEGGGHPFLTQYLMYTLWENGLENQTPAQVILISSKFPRTRPDFQKWLDGLGPAGLLSYRTLLESRRPMSISEVRAALSSVPKNLDQSLDALHYHGLVQTNDRDQYTITAGMFRRWFADNYGMGNGENPDEPKPDAINENTTHFQHGYALLVGVGADLPVTIDDATGIRDILLDPMRCAYPIDQVKLLTGEAADRQGILNGLEWLQKKVASDPKATALFFFSGHGGNVLSDYFLVPYGYDASDTVGTGVSGAELTKMLNGVAAQKILVLLDCCHAGGMAETKWLGFMKSPMPPELDAALTAGSGRVVIASSRKDELSYTGTPYSVFTQALREALAGYGAADRDGFARIADIALYVGRHVPERTQDRQHPILKLSAADNFAVAYYAGGDKAVRPLDDARTIVLPIDALDTDFVERYQAILKKYQGNLLEVESQIAEFYDRAAVPPDLIRTKRQIQNQISEVEGKLQSEAQKSGWQPPAPMPMTPTLEDILERLDSMEGSLGNKLDDLKLGQQLIYRKVSPFDQEKIEEILTEVRHNRIEQGTITSTLDAIRRALKHIQLNGLPVNDPRLEQALDGIYREMDGDLNIQQQLELSLPIIPLLLEYKVTLGNNFNLSALWSDLIAAIR